MSRKQTRQHPDLERAKVTAPTPQAAASDPAAEAALAAATKHLRAGELKEAAALYRKILETQPGNADVLNLLGMIMNQTGRNEAAVVLFGKVVALKPELAEAHNNLGNALRGLGRFDESVACFEKSITLKPSSAAAHYNLGIALILQGKFAAAVGACREASVLKPDFADAHSNLGIALMNLGKLDDAVASYRKAIALAPAIAHLHYNLGDALIRQGTVDAAIASFERAAALDPDYAEAHFALGTALKGQDRLDEATASYRTAIALKPGYAEAHTNLGVALKSQGKLEEAVAAYRTAIALKPGHAEAHHNLGIALNDQGRHDEAIASYEIAIARKPDFAEAHYNLGNALMDAGRLDEAVASCREAIALKPDFAEAHSNLGAALQRQGEPDKAVASYQKAIALDPEYAGAHNSLGNALFQQGEADKAIASFGKAIALDPNLAGAHTDLGTALGGQGKLDEAVACHRKAIALEPNLAEAHTNLGNALKNQGKLDEAIASQRKAVELGSDAAPFHSNLLLTLNYPDGISNEALFAEHLEFNERHARSLAARIQPHQNDPDPARRLRIGYVSPDFHGHSVALFIEPVLERHDHEGFEIFCYYNHGRVDEVTERLRRYADHWIGCAGMTDEALADRIRDDRIDILVDLTGHTANNRLLVFARKPAPVQATWIGYPNTTGLAAMDYRITDAGVDPIGDSEQFNTEELVRLPIAAPFRPPAGSPDVGALPAVKAGYVTFASFNNPAKVTPEMMALWAEILNGVKGSRLIIMNVTPGEAESRVRQTFANHGIADARLILRQRIPFADFLEFHNSVDIGLDTFPYNGGTTTRLGLWMGLPYITLAGAARRSRVGARLLSHIGHPELIATTPEEYVRRAVDLATDIGRLRELRAGLRERMARSPLTDGERLTRYLETAYRTMWARYCDSEHEQTGPIEVGEENGVGRA